MDNKFIRQLLPFATLMIMVIFLGIMYPDKFLTYENFMNVFRRSSIYGIVGIGMTAVIITAGIDLSVGSLLALSGMTGAMIMLKMDMSMAGMIWATLAGIGIGLLGGMLNGVLITKLKLAPFIVTLGTLSIFRGISYVMNNSLPFNVADYKWLGSDIAENIAVPTPVCFFVVLAVCGSFVLKYTRFGRYIYAVGSNSDAAYHSGIKVNRVLLLTYTLLGLLCGVAGMIQTSRTLSAQPTAGLSLELDVIAAVIIGGASLSGGKGTIMGTIIGTLLICFLRNGCTLMQIPTNVQFIVIGAVIILAVSLDQLTRGRLPKSSSN